MWQHPPRSKAGLSPSTEALAKVVRGSFNTQVQAACTPAVEERKPHSVRHDQGEGLAAGRQSVKWQAAAPRASCRCRTAHSQFGAGDASGR